MARGKRKSLKNKNGSPDKRKSANKPPKRQKKDSLSLIKVKVPSAISIPVSEVEAVLVKDVTPPKSKLKQIDSWETQYTTSDDFEDNIRLLLNVVKEEEQYIIENNAGYDAVAGRKGNDNARTNLIHRLPPEQWRCRSKLSYVYLYHSNALISSQKIRKAVYGVISELGKENATYEKVDEIYRERKLGPLKYKHLDRELYENVLGMNKSPGEIQIKRPTFDYAQGGYEICERTKPENQEDGSTIVHYKALIAGAREYNIAVNLRHILDDYPNLTSISRPRFYINEDDTLMMDVVATETVVIPLRSVSSICGWDVGSDSNHLVHGARVAIRNGHYESGRELGISVDTQRLLDKVLKLESEIQKQLEARKRKRKHDTSKIDAELENLRKQLDVDKKNLDMKVAVDIANHVLPGEIVVIEYLSWSQGCPTYRHGRILNNIKHVCQRRGILCLQVSPAYTSRICCQCGHCNEVSPPLGGDRKFRCENQECGSVLDRDYNAAVNIAIRGFTALHDKIVKNGFEAKAPLNTTTAKIIRNDLGTDEVIGIKRKLTPRRPPSSEVARKRYNEWWLNSISSEIAV